MNIYKYPDFNISREECDNILESMNYPNPDYISEEPVTVYVDLLVEKIFEINGKEMEFEAFYSMWHDWKEKRLTETLKKLNLFDDTGKRTYLCTYNPIELWGKANRLFYPTIEFYNKKSKTNVNLGGDADWVDIYSDGMVGTRLRDSAKFSANFDFRRFPFDTQVLSFELWSEFPSTLVEIAPEPISMPVYKETKFFFTDGDIQIPGWDLEKVDYYNYDYVDNDKLPYQGFYLDLTIKRQTSYYLFKIILPIIFILVISWSVFWVRGSQLEAKVNVTIVCLLSLIAYNFIIDEDLPKLSYLTFLDCFILLSYFYTGTATILCVYSFLRKLKSGRDLSVVDRYAQFIGPISYFAILFILLTYFYNLEAAKGLFLGSRFIN
ncbi:hypothetical protein IDH27_01840 [Pelagibacterales bacterium SAG-MED46]|nr:hypothetical protein [Pelagibacterales bacterium SAG-MED46]